MSLREKQSDFVMMVADLIHFVYDKGWELTFGDAYRDSRVTYGHAKSLHRSRLAIDMNLFVDGKYIRGASPEYTEIGEYWESLGGSWGGRFDDHNHFSLAHGGMK